MATVIEFPSETGRRRERGPPPRELFDLIASALSEVRIGDDEQGRRIRLAYLVACQACRREPWRDRRIAGLRETLDLRSWYDDAPTDGAA